MKKLIILLYLFPLFVYSQTIMSWNIQNLGETKFKKDSIMLEISNIMKTSNADIIAIQEVVLNSYGDSCIIYLANKLNYNYIISEKTSGNGSERYAYLYSKSILMNYNYLDKELADSIDREPYIASFTYNKKEVVIRQLHLVPSSKNPQYEVSKLNNNKDIICGDFNLTDQHLIFIKLLSVYNSPLLGQLTSLKKNDELNKSYDHFLIHQDIKYESSYVFNYTYQYNRNLISDHLPIILILK